MDLRLIRSLVAVEQQGSVGDAAQMLALSQPALSRRIQQLEEELGVNLLVRSGRGVTLTEMGRLAVREGHALIERYGRLKEDVRRVARLDEGIVRLGAGATAVSYLLPPAIARFREEHPGVRFQVREAGSRDVERAVFEEQLELGIVTLPTVTPDVETWLLREDRIVLVAGQGHPLARPGGIDVAELDGQGVVGFEAGSAIRQLIDSELRGAGVNVNVVMELRSIPAILSMVETTGSLGFVSEWGVGPERVVNVKGLRVSRKLALIAKRQRELSPAAATFAQALTGTAGSASVR